MINAVRLRKLRDITQDRSTQMARKSEDGTRRIEGEERNLTSAPQSTRQAFREIVCRVNRGRIRGKVMIVYAKYALVL